MPQPLVWQKLKSQGQTPSSRLGHTLVKFDKTYIMFGGLDSAKKGGKVAPNNETYTLKLQSKENCNWQLNSCSGTIPLPRSNHTAVDIGNNCMLVFGGLYSSNQRFNDTYILKVGKSNTFLIKFIFFLPITSNTFSFLSIHIILFEVYTEKKMPPSIFSKF